MAAQEHHDYMASDANLSEAQGDNVSVSSINLEKIFSMKGGKGELSYANNSQAQAKHASSMLHLLKETLDRIQLSSPEVPFVVADLGCSSGSNSINTVDAIIKHMAKRYDALGYDSPEFSAFFSDLPSTDFNTLFQLLPPLGNHGGSMEEALATDSHRSYFAAGVPGSFYRRLFPSRSIDLFHSAFSLHWLSQVPESVLDKRSAAYNKGRVFIHGANESTANAYKKQFQTDLASFLRSRAKELMKGGSMFLACLGRTSVDPTDQSGLGLLLGTHIQGAWDDLVQEIELCFCFFLRGAWFNLNQLVRQIQGQRWKRWVGSSMSASGGFDIFIERHCFLRQSPTSLPSSSPSVSVSIRYPRLLLAWP